jgi:hypothetical protein
MGTIGYGVFGRRWITRKPEDGWSLIGPMFLKKWERREGNPVSKVFPQMSPEGGPEMEELGIRREGKLSVPY